MPRALSSLALLGVLTGCAGYEDASLGSDFASDAGSDARTPPFIAKCDFEARRADFESALENGVPEACAINWLNEGCPGRLALVYFNECASEWANLINAID